MDPLTAGLQLGNTFLLVVLELIKATPEAERAAVAKDFTAPIHNISEWFQSVQKKINEAVK